MEFLLFVIGIVVGGAGVWYYLEKLKSKPAAKGKP